MDEREPGRVTWNQGWGGLFGEATSFGKLLRFVNLAFQSLMETGANFVWQFDWLVVAKNLNRQLRLSHDDRAAFAFAKMFFQFDANRGLELAIDVTRDFVNGAGAVQLGFLSRKK